MGTSLQRNLRILAGTAIAIPVLAGGTAWAESPPPLVTSSQPAVAANTTVADKGEHPFAVSLNISGAGCSGSLIHPSWVLTAGHCVWDTTNEVMRSGPARVTIGRSDLTGTDGEVISSDRVEVPAAFARPTENWDQDVALVHLSTPSKAQPVELVSPDRSDEIAISDAGHEMLMLGYGLVADDGSDDPFLREGRVAIKANPGVASTSPATFDFPKGELLCRGDSGGPWLVRHPDGSLRQFAVSSRTNRGKDGVCGDLGTGTSVRSRTNYDWIVGNVYPDGMGRWLTRPVSSTTGTIGDPWVSNQWRTGWAIQEFVNIGGTTHVLLYRRDDGTMKLQPMNADGTPSSFEAFKGDLPDDLTSIRPYVIGSKTFLVEMSAATGKVRIDELVRSTATGTVTRTERFSSDWSAGWTSVEPFTSGGQSGLFLLKEATGQVKSFKLLGAAPWIDMTAPVTDTTWSQGWSHVRFFPGATAGQVNLFLMKDSGEAHIHAMNGLGVGTRFQDESLGTNWTSTEFHATGGTVYLDLESRYNGATRVIRMNSAPVNNRMLGAVVQNHNAKDGNTQAKVFCVGTKITESPTSCAATSKQFIWYYREGLI